MNLGTAQVIRANSRHLPLADNSVDLVVTSPPYFALRSYQDGGEHYAGQIGDEPTPAAFVASLLEVTAECVRVLKPSGSLWVNLGDKYATNDNPRNGHGGSLSNAGEHAQRTDAERVAGVGRVLSSTASGIPRKSLIGIPWRYALACIDDLGLILRAEIIWSKPNGLPESVTDRVRRSHEQWFHFTLSPRYFSAVDEIREPHIYPDDTRHLRSSGYDKGMTASINSPLNPLGKLPGSVWTVPTEPLRVPDHLGVDHFAAFPTEWPKRIIAGWSPAGVCVACGEGRRPVRDGAWHFTQPSHDVDRAALASAQRAGVTPDVVAERYGLKTKKGDNHSDGQANVHISQLAARNATSNAKRCIGAYTCVCPEPTADTQPAVILDPFGGTGTTALVAKALGRDGITVDMSADYCRLAEWRTNDRDQLAKVLGVAKAEQQPAEQAGLFDLDGGAA